MTTFNTETLRGVTTIPFHGIDYYGEAPAPPRHQQPRQGAEPRMKMEAFWFVHIDGAGALTSHLSVLNDGVAVAYAKQSMPASGPTTRGGYSWWGIADNKQAAERAALLEQRNSK